MSAVSSMRKSVANILLYTCVLISVNIRYANCDSTVIRIGCMADSAETRQAVSLAVDYVNTHRPISPSVTLKALVNMSEVLDSFSSIQITCSHVREGVVGLIGPMSSTTTKAVAPLAKALRLPQIAPVSTNPLLGEKENFPMLLRMAAPDSVQSRALVDFVEHIGWKKMAILTSNSDYGIYGLVEFQAQAAVKKWRILSVLQFHAHSDVTQINATQQLQIIKDTGVRVVILNCLDVFGRPVLKQAHALGMTGAGWAWIVTDGITGTDGIFQGKKPVPSYLEGLVGTRPSLTESSLYHHINDVWRQNNLSENITVYAAYVVDSVLAMSAGIHDLLLATNGTTNLAGKPLDCEQPSLKYDLGHLLLDHLHKVRIEGVAGEIAFNTKGAPLNPKYDIVNLKQGGWHKIGSWTQERRLTLNKRSELIFMGGKTVISDSVSSLRNKSLIIVTNEDMPFVIINETKRTAGIIDWNNLKPNEDVSGYCIDLLLKLQEVIGFKFRLYQVADLAFGIKDPRSRKWNGMIRDLVNKKADIAVASLTINVQRENDVDFTAPFIDLGMTILMKIPTVGPVSAFRFIEPFTNRLWLYTIGTCFIVALVISFVNKFSPYDHHGKFVYIHQDAREDEALRDFQNYRLYTREKANALTEMNFANATWFSVASLLQQGGEVYPRSLSGRITSLSWWLVIVILVATYTANLAAWLTASRTSTTITNMADLYKQNKVLYGTIANSSIEQYFRDSNQTMLKSMHEFMKTRGTLVTSSKTGYKKVREGNWAYIADSSVLEYVKGQPPCNTLQLVGKLFGKLGYGFPLQKHSPYRDELTAHIIRLREIGYMDTLKRKWYEEMNECASKTGQDSAETRTREMEKAGGQLQLEQLIGVYYIMYGGMILGIIILLIEWIVTCAHSVDKNDPMKPNNICEAFMQRLKRVWKDIKYDMLSCTRAKDGDDAVPDDIHETSAINGDLIHTKGPDVNVEEEQQGGMKT